MLLSADELVVGHYYRLITKDPASTCMGTILQIFRDAHTYGIVVWARSSGYVGEQWRFMNPDMFEEISEEEATVYRLSD